MLNLSVGYKTAILGRASFADLFDGGLIHVYSGTQPTGAEQAANPSLLLATITVAGSDAGLAFYQVGPYIYPAIGTQFLLTVVNAGTPTWFRLCGPNDTNNVSFTEPRIDGLVGQQLALASPTFTQGTAIPLDLFFFTIAPLLSA